MRDRGWQNRRAWLAEGVQFIGVAHEPQAVNLARADVRHDRGCHRVALAHEQARAPVESGYHPRSPLESAHPAALN